MDHPPPLHLLNAQIRVQHLVKHDVPDKECRHGSVVQQGMHADQVFARRIAPGKPDRTPPRQLRHFAPRDRRVDAPAEMRRIDLVKQLPEVVDLAVCAFTSVVFLGAISPLFVRMKPFNRAACFRERGCFTQCASASTSTASPCRNMWCNPTWPIYRPGHTLPTSASNGCW